MVSAAADPSDDVAEAAEWIADDVDYSVGSE